VVARLLPLLLVPLLVWLSATAGSTRPLHSEPGTLDAALGAPEHPGSVANLHKLPRTLATRPVDRHAAPKHGRAVGLHEVGWVATRERSKRRTAELENATSAARELSFPYDATAPPTRV
jgi:hypothetical protein